VVRLDAADSCRAWAVHLDAAGSCCRVVWEVHLDAVDNCRVWAVHLDPEVHRGRWAEMGELQDASEDAGRSVLRVADLCQDLLRVVRQPEAPRAVGLMAAACRDAKAHRVRRAAGEIVV
jgi:hypothetical protein